MRGAASGRGLIDVAKGALFVRLICLEERRDPDLLETERGRDVPSGYPDGHCGACGLPEGHGVCLLHWKQKSAGVIEVGVCGDDVQPILAVAVDADVTRVISLHASSSGLEPYF